MSSVVKLSDELVSDARGVAQLTNRSMAGQISYWAALGKAVDLCIDGSTSRLMIKRAGDQSLSEILSKVDSMEGRTAVYEYLGSRPFPHYEAAEDSPGYMYRIEKDGSKILGRFSGREFKAKKE